MFERIITIFSTPDYQEDVKFGKVVHPLVSDTCDFYKVVILLTYLMTTSHPPTCLPQVAFGCTR